MLVALAASCSGRAVQNAPNPRIAEVPPSVTAPPTPSLTSSATASSANTPSPGATPTARPSQLYLIFDEDPIPIGNGDTYNLNDDLSLRVTVDPYPPVGLSAHLVMDLYLSDKLGVPVTDAAISISYDMFTMTHGPFEPSIIDRGNGHYLTSLDLIMFGPWGLEIEIRTPNSPETQELIIAVIVALPKD